MASSLLSNPFYSALADEHRQWLHSFDGQHLNNWEKLLADQTEPALAEAGVRRLLKGHRIDVEPGENLRGDSKRPDFRCLVGDYSFYVEVTCISKEDTDAITGFKLDGQARSFNSLNSSIFRKCKKKAGQCGEQDAPVLLAICTFSPAALLAFSPPYPNMLLAGTIDFTVTIDTKTGKSAGEIEQSSALESALFLRYEDGSDEIHPARKSIAGLLLCAPCLGTGIFGGILNPFAAKPFNQATLPNVHFDTMCVDKENNLLHMNPREGDDS